MIYAFLKSILFINEILLNMKRNEFKVFLFVFTKNKKSHAGFGFSPYIYAFVQLIMKNIRTTLYGIIRIYVKSTNSLA